jgi:transposase
MFGCARVVFNDCLRLREECRAAGETISDTEVQRRVVTLAKRTPERAWLAEVASVALGTWLARSVHDAGWSQLLRLIEEKAARYGRYFGRIGRFEPTSQVCSACGVKDGPKPLSIRTWACTACGAVHDRDVNAARNILAAGRADRLNACGGHVRPGQDLAVAVEAGTHRSVA